MNQDNTGNWATQSFNASVAAKSFLTQVMGWMFGALLLTAAVSYAFATSDTLKQLLYLIDPATGMIMGVKPLLWVVVFLPLVFILIMNFGFERLSFGVLVILFSLYATAMGMSLTTLVFTYSGVMITKAFLLTAGVFGTMAVAGWVTKADLSKLGTILMIGVLGIVVASVINVFMQNDTFSLIIDIVCIAVFTGLVAYKVQNIKHVGEQVGTSQPKFAVIEALSLYITFINLFMTILRLLNRRN
jgi:hypothetical protein